MEHVYVPCVFWLGAVSINAMQLDQADTAAPKEEHLASFGPITPLLCATD